MSTTTATGRMTLGSIYGAVTTTAGALGQAVGTVAKGVQLLDNYAEAALTEQRKRHMLEAASVDKRLLLEVTMANVQIDLAADEFCNKGARQKELFNAEHARLSELLAQLKG
jgi:hypothetical protein